MKSTYTKTLIVLFFSSLPAFSQTPQELFEQGLYTEEVLGNLQGAIHIYSQIQSPPQTTAQAHFHLGYCYFKLGQTQQAQQTWQKLINRYPQQTHFIALAVRHMPTLNTTRLALPTPPWADGEVLHYQIKTLSGKTRGAILTRAQKTTQNGQTWRFEKHNIDIATLLLSGQTFEKVDIHATGYNPITSNIKTAQGQTYETHYTPTHIELRTHENKAPVNKKIEVSETIYDEAQLLYMIRQLPIGPTKNMQLPFFSSQMERILQVKFQHTGLDTLTVSAGTFPCDQIEVTMSSDNTIHQRLKFWLSTKPTRHIIRYDAEFTQTELASITQFDDQNKTTYTDPDYGFGLTLPQGWYITNLDMGINYNRLMPLLTPEMKIDATFVMRKVGAKLLTKLTPKKVIQSDLALLKDALKDYEVRPETMTNFEISNLKGIRFAADLQINNQAKVEYRAYILGKEHIYWFIFRTDKENFENQLGNINTVINSLKAN